MREASWASLKAQYALEGHGAASGGFISGEAAGAAGHAVPGLSVGGGHFAQALGRCHPSVTEEDRRRYERLRNKLQRMRSHIVVEEDGGPAAAGGAAGATGGVAAQGVVGAAPPAGGGAVGAGGSAAAAGS